MCKPDKFWKKTKLWHVHVTGSDQNTNIFALVFAWSVSHSGEERGVPGAAGRRREEPAEHLAKSGAARRAVSARKEDGIRWRGTGSGGGRWGTGGDREDDARVRNGSEPRSRRWWPVGGPEGVYAMAIVQVLRTSSHAFVRFFTSIGK
jgi:hypothetical protein